MKRLNSFPHILHSLVLAASLACVHCNPDPDNSNNTTGDSDGGNNTSGDSDRPEPACDGHSSSIVVGSAQSLSALIESTEHCLMYGIDSSGGNVYFIDLNGDAVQKTIDVGGQPTDLALVRDQNELYVAVHDAKKIVAIDAATGEILREHSTTVSPFRIARGVGRSVYFVERDDYSAIFHMNMVNGDESTETGVDFIEPDLEASTDGNTLFVAESGLWGAKLLKLDSTDDLNELDRFLFNDGFGLPTPTRHIHINETAGRLYFADRALDIRDFSHVRGWFRGQIMTTTANGTIAASDDLLYDSSTFVRFADRLHPRGGALFSTDGLWLYEFDAEGSVLYRTDVRTLLGIHVLGQTSNAVGPLSQRSFQKLVADPNRPLLYGLDSRRNELVVIDLDTGDPLRAEVIGSAPTDLAFAPDGKTMVVATFGATELAVLDLSNQTKVLKTTLFVPGNPYRVTVSSLGTIVYVEQDGLATLTTVNLADSTIGSSAVDKAYQADVVFDTSGRFLFVGESSTADSRLFRLDTQATAFDFENAIISAEGYSYPNRNIIYRSPYVYFAGHQFDENTLADLGEFGEQIIKVSPNGRWAMSRERVYDTDCLCLVAGPAGQLPVSSPVMAISPDNTVVFQFDDSIGALFEHALPTE